MNTARIIGINEFGFSIIVHPHDKSRGQFIPGEWDAEDEPTAVGCVLYHYDRLVLIENHHRPGLEFPGGAREAGESLDDALRREVYEETGGHLADGYRVFGYKLIEHTDGRVWRLAYYVGELASRGDLPAYSEVARVDYREPSEVHESEWSPILCPTALLEILAAAGHKRP